MATHIPDEFTDLLTEKKAFGFVATNMPDGSPQVTPVWVDYDGEHIVFNTSRGRVKEQNLSRDPTVAIAIQDPENPYRYVQVRGRATFVEEGADEHIDKLAQKYLGVEEYPNRQPGEVRVKVLITPESVFPWGR